MPKSEKASSHRRPLRTIVMLAAAGASLHFGGSVADAGSFTWNNATGNWSDPSQWAGGAAPTGNDPTDVLTFGGFGATPYTATNDAVSPFRLNQLLLDNGTALATHRITGLPLRFEGANARLAEIGLRGFTIENQLQISAPSLALNVANSLVHTGTISGAGALTKTGSGTLQLAAGNTFAGAVSVNGGVVAIADDSALGDAGNAVTLNGGTLRMTTGTMSNSRAVSIGAGGGTMLTSSVGGIPTRTFAGDFSGPGLLTVVGPLGLTGASTRTGGTTLRAGGLTVKNDANLGGATAPLTFAVGPALAQSTLRVLEPTTMNRPVVVDESGSIFAEQALTLAGGISGIPNERLFLSGPVTLTGTSTFTGTLTFNRLTTGSADALPRLATAQVLGTLDLNGFDQSTANLEGNGTILLSGGADLSVGQGTLLVPPSNGTFTGYLGGSGRLMKVGVFTNFHANLTPDSPGAIVVTGGGLSATPTGLGAATTPLTLDGGTFYPVTGGSGTPLTFTKPLHIASSGRIDTLDRDVAWAAPVTGVGTLNKLGAGSLRYDATSSFAGTLFNMQGTTIVRRTVSFPNADADVSIGTFGGAGSVGGHVTVNGGAALSPGDLPGQPGILSVGQLTHAPGSNLTLQIAGRDNSFPALAEYDAVNVAGSVSLAGTLRAELAGGFTPTMLDTFTVMTWSSRTGRFDAHAFTGAPDGFTFAPTYGANALTLTYARFGDADLNSVVNLADFNALAANFGATGAEWAQGDFTGDGVVNLRDFNLLAASFGLGASGVGVTPADWAALASAVPEPAALVSLGCGLAILLPRRRRDGARA